MYTNTSFVKFYKGFQEDAFRMVFEFSEFFPDKIPTLKCILPSGVIENTKELKPAPNKAIICYGFSQTILDDKFNTLDQSCSPFIWKREDGSHALVQTWTTNFNDNFKSSFTITDNNPDESKFSPVAVKEFEQTCVNLFGEAARGRTKFCHKQTKNNNPVFVGTKDQLLSLIMANPIICKNMNILSIFDGGFVAGTVDGKGNTGNKSFNMASGVEYALYTKQGWDTMACVTPLEQFTENRVLLY